jgi:hypothetical protein
MIDDVILCLSIVIPMDSKNHLLRISSNAVAISKLIELLYHSEEELQSRILTIFSFFLTASSTSSSFLHSLMSLGYFQFLEKVINLSSFHSSHSHHRNNKLLGKVIETLDKHLLSTRSVANMIGGNYDRMMEFILMKTDLVFTLTTYINHFLSNTIVLYHSSSEDHEEEMILVIKGFHILLMISSYYQKSQVFDKFFATKVVRQPGQNEDDRTEQFGGGGGGNGIGGGGAGGGGLKMITTTNNVTTSFHQLLASLVSLQSFQMNHSCHSSSSFSSMIAVHSLPCYEYGCEILYSLLFIMEEKEKYNFLKDHSNLLYYVINMILSSITLKITNKSIEILYLFKEIPIYYEKILSSPSSIEQYVLLIFSFLEQSYYDYQETQKQLKKEEENLSEEKRLQLAKKSPTARKTEEQMMINKLNNMIFVFDYFSRLIQYLISVDELILKRSVNYDSYRQSSASSSSSSASSTTTIPVNNHHLFSLFSQISMKYCFFWEIIEEFLSCSSSALMMDSTKICIACQLIITFSSTSLLSTFPSFLSITLLWRIKEKKIYEIVSEIILTSNNRLTIETMSSLLEALSTILHGNFINCFFLGNHSSPTLTPRRIQYHGTIIKEMLTMKQQGGITKGTSYHCLLYGDANVFSSLLSNHPLEEGEEEGWIDQLALIEWNQDCLTLSYSILGMFLAKKSILQNMINDRILFYLLRLLQGMIVIGLQKKEAIDDLLSFLCCRSPAPSPTNSKSTMNLMNKSGNDLHNLSFSSTSVDSWEKKEQQQQQQQQTVSGGGVVAGRPPHLPLQSLSKRDKGIDRTTASSLTKKSSSRQHAHYCFNMVDLILLCNTSDSLADDRSASYMITAAFSFFQQFSYEILFHLLTTLYSNYSILLLPWISSIVHQTLKRNSLVSSIVKLEAIEFLVKILDLIESNQTTIQQLPLSISSLSLLPSHSSSSTSSISSILCFFYEGIYEYILFFDSLLTSLLPITNATQSFVSSLLSLLCYFTKDSHSSPYLLQYPNIFKMIFLLLNDNSYEIIHKINNRNEIVIKNCFYLLFYYTSHNLGLVEKMIKVSLENNHLPSGPSILSPSLTKDHHHHTSPLSPAGGVSSSSSPSQRPSYLVNNVFQRFLHLMEKEEVSLKRCQESQKKNQQTEQQFIPYSFSDELYQSLIILNSLFMIFSSPSFTSPSTSTSTSTATSTSSFSHLFSSSYSQSVFEKLLLLREVSCCSHEGIDGSYLASLLLLKLFLINLFNEEWISFHFSWILSAKQKDLLLDLSSLLVKEQSLEFYYYQPSHIEQLLTRLENTLQQLERKEKLVERVKEDLKITKEDLLLKEDRVLSRHPSPSSSSSVKASPIIGSSSPVMLFDASSSSPYHSDNEGKKTGKPAATQPVANSTSIKKEEQKITKEVSNIAGIASISKKTEERSVSASKKIPPTTVTEVTKEKERSSSTSKKMELLPTTTKKEELSIKKPVDDNNKETGNNSSRDSTPSRPTTSSSTNKKTLPSSPSIPWASSPSLEFRASIRKSSAEKKEKQNLHHKKLIAARRAVRKRIDTNKFLASVFSDEDLHNLNLSPKATSLDIEEMLREALGEDRDAKDGKEEEEEMEKEKEGNHQEKIKKREATTAEPGYEEIKRMSSNDATDPLHEETTALSLTTNHETTIKKNSTKTASAILQQEKKQQQQLVTLKMKEIKDFTLENVMESIKMNDVMKNIFLKSDFCKKLLKIKLQGLLQSFIISQNIHNNTFLLSLFQLLTIFYEMSQVGPISEASSAAAASSAKKQHKKVKEGKEETNEDDDDSDYGGEEEVVVELKDNEEAEQKKVVLTLIYEKKNPQLPPSSSSVAAAAKPSKNKQSSSNDLMEYLTLKDDFSSFNIQPLFELFFLSIKNSEIAHEIILSNDLIFETLIKYLFEFITHLFTKGFNGSSSSSSASSVASGSSPKKKASLSPLKRIKSSKFLSPLSSPSNKMLLLKKVSSSFFIKDSPFMKDEYSFILSLLSYLIQLMNYNHNLFMKQIKNQISLIEQFVHILYQFCSKKDLSSLLAATASSSSSSSSASVSSASSIVSDLNNNNSNNSLVIQEQKIFSSIFHLLSAFSYSKITHIINRLFYSHELFQSFECILQHHLYSLKDTSDATTSAVIGRNNPFLTESLQWIITILYNFSFGKIRLKLILENYSSMILLLLQLLKKNIPLLTTTSLLSSSSEKQSSSLEKIIKKFLLLNENISKLISQSEKSSKTILTIDLQELIYSLVETQFLLLKSSSFVIHNEHLSIKVSFLTCFLRFPCYYFFFSLFSSLVICTYLCFCFCL